MDHNELRENGYRVFGLYGATEGRCNCGKDSCISLFKHPISSGWQHTPDWSDEQWEVAHMAGQFDTGYGVLTKGLVVVDVDARNGGVESFSKLCEIVPEISECGFIVETGSGGGSKHLYFSVDESLALRFNFDGLPGIDAKSGNSFVVGPGSMHSSGNIYRAVVGSPADISPAPESLLRLLIKPERHRAELNGSTVDLSDSDLTSMLGYVDPDCDHETWVRCGMAVHHVTAGTGLSIWDEWSSKGSKYPGHDVIERRWHSFGKSSNPVTLGTLRHYAEEAGWVEPVTFSDDSIVWESDDNPLDISGVDLLRPPGFTGEVAQWINSQSLYPRETLAVAAALMTISNVAGMRYEDPVDHSAFNLFCFGVSDSSTGKEAVLQAHNSLLRAAGVTGALVGGIKSEQEVYRNLLRHQAAYYAIDELGEHLSKIMGARKKGGTPYLEGVIGALMSIYSKSNSFVQITGDLKEEVRQALIQERARLEKAEDDPHGKIERRISRIQHALETIDMGIENPFLSIFGLTTPERFNDLMDFDNAANGFIGRALIFKEHNANPKIKPRNKRIRPGVPDSMAATLQNLYSPGSFEPSAERVERIGDKCPIKTSPEAIEALDAVSDKFWELAEYHKDETGLHAIPRRGYELVAKVSAVLAIPSGLRTVEHVRWAYALVSRDIEGKLRLVHSNSAVSRQDALTSKILSVIGEHGETVRGIKRKCRSYQGADVDAALLALIKSGQLREEEIKQAGAGRPVKMIYIS